MKLNWKVRFKNKTFLVTFLTAIVALVYQIASMFDIVPSVSEGEVTQAIMIAVNLLVALGIIVDPTTEGISDSERALKYDNPSK